MRGFIWSVAAGVTVVFVTRYLSARSTPQPSPTSTVAAANPELESEIWA